MENHSDPTILVDPTWPEGVDWKWPAGPLRLWGTATMFACMLLNMLSIPLSLDYKYFAFYDPGAALKADWLITAAGGSHMPTVDFSWSYGLLSLEVGRLWFAVVGRSPGAFWGFCLAGSMVVAWGLARLGKALNLGAMQWLLLMLSLPLIVPGCYLSLTHVAEAAFILHALADQARGKTWRALLWVTIAAMFKPSLSYVYGAILLGILIWRTWHPTEDNTVSGQNGAGDKTTHRLGQDRRAGEATRRQIVAGKSGNVIQSSSVPDQDVARRASQLQYPHSPQVLPAPGRPISRGLNQGGPWRYLLRQLWPAALAFAVYVVISLAWFGWRPLVHTVFPMSARESYRAAGFGFFTAGGRQFWILNDPWQYLFTPSGWWLIATTLLWPAGLMCLVQMIRRRPVHGGGTILTMGLLHAVFVFGLYAWSGSWNYYAYLPAVGLVWAAGRITSRKTDSAVLTSEGSAGSTSGLTRAEDTPPGSQRVAGVPGDVGMVRKLQGPVAGDSQQIGGQKQGSEHWIARPSSGEKSWLRRWGVGLLAMAVVTCACRSRAVLTVNEWKYKEMSPATEGLFIYPDQLAMLKDCQEQVAGQKTYWLVNGYIGQMLEGIKTPPSWWLSPALQTPTEIAAIRDGIARSQSVVRWAEHGRLDPWLDPQLSDLTKDFAPAYSNDWFIVEKRRDGGGATYKSVNEPANPFDE